MQTPSFLYKILSNSDWIESQSQINLTLSPDDDEFIHFSTEDQLPRITQKYWSHVSDYVILKIDVSKLKGRLVYEANPGGTSKYYHLYDGAIPTEAVIQITRASHAV